VWQKETDFGVRLGLTTVERRADGGTGAVPDDVQHRPGSAQSARLAADVARSDWPPRRLAAARPARRRADLLQVRVTTAGKIPVWDHLSNQVKIVIFV